MVLRLTQLYPFLAANKLFVTHQNRTSRAVFLAHVFNVFNFLQSTLSSLYNNSYCLTCFALSQPPRLPKILPLLCVRCLFASSFYATWLLKCVVGMCVMLYCMVLFCWQLHVLGGAALSMTGSDAHLKTSAVFGDNSGRVTVRRDQTYNVTQEARVLLPHALLAQRHSTVNLPPKLICRSLDVILKGTSATLCIA